MPRPDDDQQLAPLLGRTMVVVAHADDECVGCGALLQRMREPLVVFMTDGAPRPEYFWKRWGSREAYARLRQQEARAALRCVGISNIEFAADRVPELVDQELFRALPQAYEALEDIAEKFRPEALLTITYEGGHPDHDSCCLLTSALGERLDVPRWEFPLYHRAGGGSHGQAFMELNGSEVQVRMTPEELQNKIAMWKTYASQGDILAAFDPKLEPLRPMPEHDFSCPAHDGQLNYEVWQWGISGSEVCERFVEFLENHGPRVSARVTAKTQQRSK
jgi:N-acetylglucosamine malate deacetylase 2